MENYDNFFNFNDQGRTPVYHTPDPVDPKDNKSGKKFTVITVLFVVIALIMCIAIVANVVVLASMKTQVSQDYADSMVDAVREEYINAINEYLADRDIPADVIAQIEENVIKELTTSAAVVAGTKTVFSTAQVIAKTRSGTNPNLYNASYGSGFLITAADANGTTARYIVTNAHVVLRTATTSSGWFGSTYSFTPHDEITCSFMNRDSGEYELEVFAVGSYREVIEGTDEIVDSSYTDKPDLAVLKFVDGNEPDEEKYPSLNIATKGANYGDSIAIVGYPSAGGTPSVDARLSLSSGIISATAHPLSSWGAGEFYQTDGAINGGNSGGPMVNNKNEVVGIVESKIVTEEIENIGYAVTSKTLIDFLAENGLTPVTV